MNQLQAEVDSVRLNIGLDVIELKFLFVIVIYLEFKSLCTFYSCRSDFNLRAFTIILKSFPGFSFGPNIYSAKAQRMILV